MAASPSLREETARLDPRGESAMVLDLRFLVAFVFGWLIRPDWSLPRPARVDRGRWPRDTLVESLTVRLPARRCCGNGFDRRRPM